MKKQLLVKIVRIGIKADILNNSKITFTTPSVTVVIVAAAVAIMSLKIIQTAQFVVQTAV